MKHVIGVLVAVALSVVLGSFREYVPEFVAGWFCCTGYFASVRIYERKPLL